MSGEIISTIFLTFINMIILCGCYNKELEKTDEYMHFRIEPCFP